MRFDRTLFRRCRTYNEPSHLPAAGSQITKTVASISASGLVFSSAGFGAVFAWTSGAEHGPLLASLMVVMAVALELAKPLAVSAAFNAFRSWAFFRGVALALLAIVAIVYSLSAELSLVAGSRGDLVAKREATIEQHDDRRDSVKSARAELAAQAPSRTVAEAQADITKLLASNPRADGCRNEIMANATQRRVCPQVAALNGEIGRAERRSELETKIGKATDRPASAPIVKNADPGGAALATYLATLGLTVPAAKLSDWIVLVPVLALELGAALSGLLVQSVSGAAAVSVQTGHQTASVVEQKPDTRTDTRPAQPDSASPDAERRVSPGDPAERLNEKRTPRKAKKRTRNKGGKGGGGGGGQSGKRRPGNVVDLLKAKGGHIRGGQREIAKQLRLSKSRANELLHAAAAAGTVRLQTTRYGTSVALVA